MKKSYKIVLLIVVALSLLAILLIVLTHSNQNSPRTIDNAVVSAPVSSAVASNTIDFTLPISTIDPNNPYLDSSFHFTSSTNENLNIDTKILDKGHIQISSNNFSLLFYNAGEGNPWNGTVSTDNVKVFSFFNKQVFRVNENDDQDIKALLTSYNLNYIYNYFYTQNYNPGCMGQFSQDQYCGDRIIEGLTDAQGLQHNFAVECMVNDKQYLSQCDEVINNLKVTIENNP